MLPTKLGLCKNLSEMFGYDIDLKINILTSCFQSYDTLFFLYCVGKLNIDHTQLTDTGHAKLCANFENKNFKYAWAVDCLQSN
jgi:hypothetical protein